MDYVPLLWGMACVFILAAMGLSPFIADEFGKYADRRRRVDFEKMMAGDDGWSDWIHPLPGYRMKCCDCGLVHWMQFAIVTANGDEASYNDGEDEDAVVIFRARRLRGGE